jgi:diguanylate cyclase (GGDEF)-like protein
MDRRKLKTRPLLFYVVALATAIATPPLLVSGLLAVRWVKSEQTRLQEQTHEVTEAALSKVDTYLAGKIAMLQALATSPALEARDFQRLDRQARELLDLQGLNIILRDLDGNQLVNTRRPWGSTLEKIQLLEPDRLVASTRLPFVSDIYEGPVSKLPLVRVIVPVIQGGKVEFTLNASLPPEGLAKLLRDAGIARPRFGSITDRQGRIIARADHDPAHVGRALPGFDEAPGPKGSWHGTNVSGVEVFGTYRRSPLSGWLFTGATEAAALKLPLYRSLVLLAGLAVVMGLLGFAVSWLIVRTVLRSQAAVASAAMSLGSGKVVDPPDTAVAEANEVGRALSSASLKLHEQAVALTSLNRDLERRVAERTQEVRAQSALIETTLDNMAQGLMVIDADGTVPICNQRALELLELPAELMASRPTFEAVRRYQLEMGEFRNASTELRSWVESRGKEGTAHSYVRERPNGIVLEIKSVPLADGSIVRTYTDITTHKEAERVAFQMAREDPLTGLANRTRFVERLAERISAQDSGLAAVLCLDLDRFKAVNDTFGHFAGDALLMEVAARIKEIAAPEDTVARFAGDEFAILRANAGHANAESFAREVLQSLSEPFVLEGSTRVVVGASIGIALIPGDATVVDEILKCADLALYRAKREGRSTLRFFEPAMDVAARERRSLELDLSQALSRGEFELHYQPVVKLAGTEICSFEALLRWRHPSRGYIPPSDFVPLAEDAKLIPEIGEWVLQQACIQASLWPQHVGVAVNISPLQFQGPSLVDTVLSALRAAKLSPTRLELEVTEAVLMQECEQVLTTLRALRQLGVRIALDDFGTGYSSLSYLHRFPLDRIKIDRSFISASADPTSAAIVRTIIGLGTRLGTAITAEGVETKEQLDFVREEGCHAAQGFLFSKPLPAAQAGLLIGRPISRAA